MHVSDLSDHQAWYGTETDGPLLTLPGDFLVKVDPPHHPYGMPRDL